MNDNNIPDGMKRVFDQFNSIWVIRPEEGYSEKYLKEDTFIPKTKNDMSVVKKEYKNKKNKSLHVAKKNKFDEFYTTLDTITDELKYYDNFFKNKIVYCPCDKGFNLGRSEFVNYFISNFNRLGIKKLICTQYNPNGQGEVYICDVFGNYQSQNKSINGYKWEYNGEYPDDTKFVDESKINIYFLSGNGSFDSKECKEIMKECDVVVTNPPFSKIDSFINQLMEYNKKFIILGDMKTITKKTVYPFIRDNKIWLGISLSGTKCSFKVPNEYNGDNTYIEDGVKYAKVNSVYWFTNIDHNKRHTELYLGKTYDKNKYPQYLNLDGIDVDKLKNIPKDYTGIMGVPITFLYDYCPEQFEIIGFRKGDDGKDLRYLKEDGTIKEPFFRILIKNKKI